MNHRTNKNSARLILLFLSIALSCNTSFSQTNSADSVRILGIEKELVDAISTGDSAAWKKHMDDSFMVVEEDGSRTSKQQFISSLRGLPKGYSGHIDITKPSVVIRNNAAILNYVADEEEIVYGQKLHTTYATMTAYYKSVSEWKIFSEHIFEIPQNPAPINLTKGILEKYTGVYKLSDDITYTVTIENNRLFGERIGRKKQELLPETENVFFTADDSRGRKLFMKDPDGKMQMLARRNGNDVVWTKVR